MKGVGRVFKRGNWLWISWYRHGREYREAAHTQNQAVARRLLAEKIKSDSVPRANRVRFEDIIAAVVADYKLRGLKTLYDVQKVRLKHLRPFFKNFRAVDITALRLKAYADERLKEGAAPSSINRELNVVRRGFRLLIEEGLVSAIPAGPHLPETNVRRGFVLPGDFQSIVAYLKPHDREVSRWLYLSGWRLSEALSLEWRDVDLETGEVRLRAAKTKTGISRKIPLGPGLIDVIETQQRELKCPYVFHWDGRRISRGAYSGRWRAAATAAGFKGVMVHDLRRSAVRNMIIGARVPEKVVMEFTGHRTRSMLDRYTISSPTDMLNAQQAMRDWLVNQPKTAVVPFKRKAEE